MKTGRRRKKEPRPEAPEPTSPAQPTSFAPPTPPAQPASFAPPTAARPRPAAKKSVRARTPARLGLIALPIIAVLIVLVLGIILCGRSCFGPRATPATYLPATAEGSWTATVKVMAPQVEAKEGWRSDCEANANCTVVPGTCELREREDKYTERQVDEYDDYAYNIYYEEAESQVYEAQGDSFAVTQLNPQKDWWDGDRHYFSEEWLDEETCQYTQYTVWITDPENADYEVEVVLSECEVWDHVVVKERVYEQEDLCQTENRGAMVVQDTRTREGAGSSVEWPGVVAPPGGELERSFEGTVVFRADGAKRTVTETDVDKYVRYLTVPYYLGLDKEGNVVALTDKAP
jgi:hypothetical protein